MMHLKKILLYYNTLKYLRWKQISYRIWYFLRKRGRKWVGFSYKFEKNTPLFVPFIPMGIGSINALFQSSIAFQISYFNENNFTFLNKNKKFNNDIDWEFADYGKLWTYNLTYFDFLNQKENEHFKSDFIRIIEDFIQKQPSLNTANEPFPTALRGINWVKYFTKNKLQNPRFDRSLFHQFQILADNIEYHLLGNHLLENGFSMLFGAIYFQHAPFFKTANNILTTELKEQILADGAHFELCPMYHKIMLFRVLDCYNLLKTPISDWQYEIESLKKLLSDKAGLMLGWLDNMTYSDGGTPHFGDSTTGIAPTSKELFEYAERVQISKKTTPLSISGFRKLQKGQFELIAKIGKIGPDYIPGHAHADSLSFELSINNKLLLVDTGISTYETNERRQLERSTASHNTVEINGQNSSEVWGSFRIGNRAKTTLLKDTPTELWATHDGYKKWGVHHERQFSLQDKSVLILDKTGENVVSKAFWHFHPNIILTKDNTRVYFENGEMEFLIPDTDKTKGEEIEIIDYLLPTQYNTFLKAKKVIITFNSTLKTRITLYENPLFN